VPDPSYLEWQGNETLRFAGISLGFHGIDYHGFRKALVWKEQSFPFCRINGSLVVEFVTISSVDEQDNHLHIMDVCSYGTWNFDNISTHLLQKFMME
jgi:hypothetical protein